MIIIDVREKEEFQAEHIQDSVNIPLSQFDLLAPGIVRNLRDAEITLMCHSGNRARMTIEELKKLGLGLDKKITVYEGGIVSWKKEGKPTVGQKTIFPIMRQVQIVAGAIALTSFFGTKFIDGNFIYLSLLVGFGLSLAGWTGFCPMVYILQKMPWNSCKKSDSCDTKTNKKPSCCN